MNVFDYLTQSESQKSKTNTEFITEFIKEAACCCEGSEFYFWIANVCIVGSHTS